MNAPPSSTPSPSGFAARGRGSFPPSPLIYESHSVPLAISRHGVRVPDLVTGGGALKVDRYRVILGLWLEAELGPARNLRPHGLTSFSPMFGLTLAEQGYRVVASRDGYGAVRDEMRHRYVLGRRPRRDLRLEAWEARFDADLARSPALLIPPAALPCEAEAIDRIASEVDALVSRRVA